MAHKFDIVRAARQLLKLLYNIYCQNVVVQRYGIYPWNLTKKSGIKFSNGGQALSAVYLMWRYGWIRLVSPKTRDGAASFCRIQLTMSGIKEAQSRQLLPKIRKPLRGSYTTTMDDIARGSVRDLHN